MATVAFSQVNSYVRFFDLTSPQKIEQYAHGAHLDKLARLAEEVRNNLDSLLPNQQDKLNHLSKIKERLSQAVTQKRAYYENHWFGRITKFFLQLIGKWNNGDTAAIMAAEDFLLFWDSRHPVSKNLNPDMHSWYGKYSLRHDFVVTRQFLEVNPNFPHRNLDLSQFFNYNPRREIEMDSGERIKYADLRV